MRIGNLDPNQQDGLLLSSCVILAVQEVQEKNVRKATELTGSKSMLPDGWY